MYQNARCLFTLALAVMSALASVPVLAEGDGRGQPVDLVTNFENGEVIGADGLLIGEGDAEALLSGGQVEIRGVRSAYQSPPHAWVFDPGESGAIEFAHPVRELRFFAAVNVPRGSTEAPRGSGFFTLLDADGEVIDHPILLLGDQEDAQSEVFHDGLAVPLIDGHPQTLFSVKPVSVILIDNSAAGASFLTIDDLGYRVVVKNRR